MMFKVLLIVVVGVLTTLGWTVKASPTYAYTYKSRPCQSNDDCNTEDECCLVNPEDTDAKYCRPLSTLGRPCQIPLIVRVQGVPKVLTRYYPDACPCEFGLKCVNVTDSSTLQCRAPSQLNSTN